jgi:hypothetical protein
MPKIRDRTNRIVRIQGRGEAVKLEIYEDDLIKAEFELEEANRRLRAANRELIEADLMYGERCRRYDELVAAKHWPDSPASRETKP